MRRHSRGAGEASTGAPMGWVLSHEKLKLQGADAVEKSGRPHGGHRYSEVPAGPARSETHARWETFCAGTGRFLDRLPRPSPDRSGKASAGDPLMHDRGKLDSSMVATKRQNKFR